MKAVLQDIYRVIDQDDYEEASLHRTRNLSHLDDSITDNDESYYVNNGPVNESVIFPEKRTGMNLESGSRSHWDGQYRSSSRLTEAIDALRSSIQGSSTQGNEMTSSKSRSKRNMSLGGNKMGLTRDSHCTPEEENLKIRTDKVAVEVRIVFLKIGEIDTLKELYHADAFIQAKWREPRLDGQTSDQLASVDYDKYWSPLLYIDNILTETKDAMWLSAVADDQNKVSIVERRRLKGVFLETLELNDFPLDVQDLTITMTTERSDTEVDLIPDQIEVSSINIQTFVDQQEWILHEHVEITKRIILQEYSTSMKSHPGFSVTCRAARRPGYFYWNVFLIMFMISGLSFATFSVSPEKAEYRLRLSFTLVLTSVTFKYVITQSLPKISYLTYMDKYVLMSLAILCIVSIWHACVTLIPQSSSIDILNMLHKNNSNARLKPSNVNFTLRNKEMWEKLEKRSILMRTLLRNIKQLEMTNSEEVEEEPVNMETDDGEKKLNPEQIDFLKRMERDVFISFGIVYLVAHFVFIFWLYFDASKRRRIMRQKDKEYRKLKIQPKVSLKDNLY